MTESESESISATLTTLLLDEEGEEEVLVDFGLDGQWLAQCPYS